MKRTVKAVETTRILACAAVLVSLAGCATQGLPQQPGSSARRLQSPGNTAPADAPLLEAIDRLRLSERHEVGAAGRRLAHEAVNALAMGCDEGHALLLAGDEDGALDAFDGALDAFLAARLDVDSDPELRDRAESLMASIHEATLGLAAQQADSNGLDIPGGDIEEDAGLLAAFRQGQGAAPHPVSHLPLPEALEFAPEWSIPMADHPAIDSMVGFYSGRARERFEIGLARYGQYAPTVRRILAEEGVPPDLAWLALVESNYNAKATSRARAHGLWQFIPATGRRYGLAQDFWVDERADFEKATRSAARYLRDLHGMFGDWHLAIAAYNAGEGKIGRGLRATGTKDFWALRDTRYIRVETKNYVPALLAVMRIVRDPAAYGVNLAPAACFDWDTVAVSASTDLKVLAECCRTTADRLEALNPELRHGVTPGTGSPYKLRVPRGSGEEFAVKYAALPPESRLTWTRHEVRPGDTLGRIAEARGSSVAAILAANGLQSANRISVGWSLIIPTGDSARGADFSRVAAAVGNTSTRTTSTASTRLTYRVRPGDTLSSIARRHGTSVSSLASSNGLRNTGKIHVGQRLTIEGGRAASSASSSSASARRTHVVRRGDTLSKIAAVYRTSVANIASWNNMSSHATIHPGDRLTILAR